MAESLSVRFRSSAFPKDPSEDAENVNPNRWGKRLAEFLRDQLPEFGVPTEDILCEDWGWLVNVKNEEFPLWLGCGPVDSEEWEERTEFMIFISAEVSMVHRILNKPFHAWFRPVDPQPQIRRVEAGLRQLVAARPEFQDVVWETVPAS